MKNIKAFKKVCIDKLTLVMNHLDPTGHNAKKYTDMINGMTDEKFVKWCEFLFEDPMDLTRNLYLEVDEYDRPLLMENIEKAADSIKVPLREKVITPYVAGKDGLSSVTPEPVYVIYFHEKRMQQAVMKKNAASIDIKQRNPLTGQVTGDDKNGRNSDVEAFAMRAISAKQGLREFMGARADDTLAKNQMYSQITNNGYVSLDSLDSNPENKVALNTMDVYFAGMGFKTNLVHGGNILSSARKRN